MTGFATDAIIAGRAEAGGGEALPAEDPATGEALARVPSADPDQAERALAAAAQAFERWRFTTPRERSRLLLRLADAIEGSAERLADIETANTGKPAGEALSVDVANAADVFRFFAGAGRCIHAPAAGEYRSGATSTVRRDPLGVVLGITPWNYPLLMAAWKAAPALAAGNVVILKPSEATPLSTLALGALAAAILPAGVLQVLPGDGRLGAALVDDPRVAVISVTGSTETGRRVAGSAARRLARTHLELGGKSPVIVCADADLEAAAAGICGAGFYNAGQDCTAASTVYVERPALDRITALLETAVGGIELGRDMGPIIAARHAEKVEALVDTGRAGLVTGGGFADRPGRFYRPTLVAGIAPRDRLAQEEVFGPVVTLSPVESAEQAVAHANAQPFGLASSVWTRDAGRAAALAAQLAYGVTWVNTHGVMASEMPHGGCRSSGNGVDLSALALDAYTQARHVVWSHGR